MEIALRPTQRPYTCRFHRRLFLPASLLLMPAFLLMLALSTAYSCRAGDIVGFREIAVPDPLGRRPLHVVIWYPSDDPRSQSTVGGNAAFEGLPVSVDATALAGPHPLVVLSHGFGGSWRNLAWLADVLARNGYVVAAPDHPGTTYSDRRPSEATRLWERPRDISRTIDALLADPVLGNGVSTSRIAAIGHSLGGWTVAELAGGRFDTGRLAGDCEVSPGSELCSTYRAIGIGGSGESRAALQADLADRRIGAAVTLDMGPARGFTPESLAAIRIPFLVVAAGSDISGRAATKKDSAYLASGLPAATGSHVEIADALHFTFMQICKPGAAALIEAETPGDGVVCRDGGTRSRQAIHDEVAAMILSFLAGALPDR